MYREGEGEDFLDEVGGGDGAEDPLDPVLLLLHVGLFVELKSSRGKENMSDGLSQRVTG